MVFKTIRLHHFANPGRRRHRTGEGVRTRILEHRLGQLIHRAPTRSLPSKLRNFPVAVEFLAGGTLCRGSFRSTTPRRHRRHARALAAAAPAVRRAPDRARPARQPPRVRGARGALPGAPARLLPAHAVEQGRRGGRAAGGVRGRVQRDPGRRARDQRAAVAVPDRAQPVAQPPAPHAGGRGRLDGRAPVRARPDDRRQGPPPRGLPDADRGRPGAAGDAAHRAAAARDRRALLRADRRGDGDHRPVGEVAARARAGLARRGGRGAAALVRGGPPGAGRGRRGPGAHDRAGAPPPAHLRPLLAPSASSCARPTRRSPRCSRSARCSCSRRRCSPTSARPPRPAAAPPPPRAAPRPRARPPRRPG